MAGLSSIVNLGYHGTSPAIADAIAASGFKGGTFPTWAGKGNIFTSNIDVAQRYGPRQLGVVTSGRNLTSPIGGGIGQGGISFGKEVVTKPAQATKGMSLYNKLMSGAYTSSPTAQRLLQTGTTAIKNPFNWAKAMNLPLSALTGILSSTPANADEIEWQNRMMQNQRFKQQQLMNRRRQNMQQTIRQAEAAKKKVITTTPKGPPSITQKKKVTTTGGPTEIKSYDPSIKKTGPTYGPHKKTKVKVKAKHSPHGGGQGGYTPPKKKTVKAKHSPHGGGPGGGGGQKSKGGHKAPGGGGYGPHRGGRNPWGRADGGLIRLFKYGGFLG